MIVIRREINTKLRQFVILQFIQKNQKDTNCQASTTWFCEKAILKEKIHESL